MPGKVSVLESVQYDYSQTPVYGLPPLESDTKGESVRSYSRVDWTIAASQFPTALQIVDFQHAVEHLYTMYTTPGFTDEKIHLFVATGLTLSSVGEPTPLRTELPVVCSAACTGSFDAVL